MTNATNLISLDLGNLLFDLLLGRRIVNLAPAFALFGSGYRKRDARADGRPLADGRTLCWMRTPYGSGAAS